jgi:outer membrane protein TolC
MRWRPYVLRLCRFLALIVGTTLWPAASPAAQQGPPPSPGKPVVRLTLQDALDRARRNSVSYQAVVTESRIAHEDTKQAIDALLPSINYNNSAIYTEGTGLDNSVKFIANNAVHEYISQGNVHEALDLAGFAAARRAAAAAAAARFRAEIASRGLVVTVVQGYFTAAAAQSKLQVAQRAADEGDRFLKLTQDLEQGGEVAHSDVIKAELQANDRRRQLREAKLALLNARLDLSILIFQDFNDSFELAEDLHANVPLPTLTEFQTRAAVDNPDIRAALEAAKAAGQNVFAARGGYIPSLSFDYFYGIDATRFATRTDGISNLGSSAVATLNIPIWNWGATQSKVKQAELQRNQAKRDLSLTQRKLLAEIQSLYAEAQTASDELISLERSSELGAESLRLTTLRYKSGESTVLEVVDAQNAAMQSDTAYQDGAVRYRVALANLQTLTGVVTTP